MTVKYAYKTCYGHSVKKKTCAVESTARCNKRFPFDRATAVNHSIQHGERRYSVANETELDLAWLHLLPATFQYHLSLSAE